MTNFVNPKPYINNENLTASLKPLANMKKAAIDSLIEISKKNRRITEAETKSAHENPRR